MATSSNSADQSIAGPLLRPAPRAPSLRSRGRPVRLRFSGRHMVVLSLATLVAMVVATTVTRARTTTNQLGLTAPVVVATQTIGPGVPIDASNTSIQQRPIGFVPSLAIDSAEPGTEALATISAGEVLTSHRLVGPTGIGSFESAVVIPTVIHRQDLSIGDLVQVFGLMPFGGDDTPIGATAEPLANGRILEVLDQAVVVVVPSSTVSMVLETLAVGAAEVVQQPNS